MSKSNADEILPTRKEKMGYTYFYYMAYYPTRFKVSEELQEVRRDIWNFKDGTISTQVAESLKEDISQYGLTQPMNEWWLCIIPASTEEKTRIRFMAFCETYCQGTQINNGYNLLKVQGQREARHLTKDRNSISILNSIDFGSVRGKRILLFDDIYTTGRSFTRVARHLTFLGAIEVVGLFLGKTHWLDENQ